MSDTLAVKTLFRIDTSTFLGVHSPNRPASTKSAALLGINYRVVPSAPWTKRVDVSVIPGISQALRKPIQVVLRREGELFLAGSTELDIVEGGMSEGEALEEFCRFFAIEAQSLIDSLDDSLGNDALQLRDKYREYLGT